MEDPLNHAAKKKPAFTFWERQRNDTNASPGSAAPPAIASVLPSTSPSPSRAQRIDPSDSTPAGSPSMQRTASATSTPGNPAALSGVQRLIQQYQSGAASANPSTSSQLDRSPSARRNHSASPQPLRVASSSAQPPRVSSVAPTLSDSTARTDIVSAPPPTQQPFASAFVSTSSSSSHPTTSSDVTNETEADKIRRRNRLLQEQMRKRNSKRRSAGAIDANDSDDDQSSPLDPLALSAASTSNSRSSSSSSRHLDVPSDTDPNTSTRSSAESNLVTPSKPTTAAAAAAAAATAASNPTPSNPHPSVRRPSLPTTRSFLEFSPLLPEGELFDSPAKPVTPSFNILHDSVASDLSGSTSQSSTATTDAALPGSLRPSPSRSNSASDSPISPTSLGYSGLLQHPPTASYLSMKSPTTPTSQSRSHRPSKLPPPRPTPHAPLPPPPSVASSTASSAALRNNPLPAPPIQDPSDVFGSQPMRSRSYSLEQKVDSADPKDAHHLVPQPAPPTSTLAVPMIRQRSNSLQRKDREAMEAAAKTSAKSSPSPASASSSRGSIMGRPRGFTVGAVPGPSGSVKAGYGQTPAKTRSRSLLSNEILPLDLAEPRYKASRDASDPRKAYSMDIDRRRSLSTSNYHDGSERLMAKGGDRRPSLGGRSRSGSSASLLQQVNLLPKSHASFVIAVVGHAQSGKSTVIKKGLRQFGLSKPHVLSEKVTSHSTVCVVDQEQRTIEVLEIDASVLLNGPSKRFAWPKFLPNIDAVILCYDAAQITSFRGMSELLENLAVAELSTVMLACKSEIVPKAVDPYYASDMACIYNVGLAECTVKGEEGKKRMRDCFSYLVKEVAKKRAGRARRGASSAGQQPAIGSLGADASPTSSEPAALRARGYSIASSGLGRSEASVDDVSPVDQIAQRINSTDLNSSDASGALISRTVVSAGPNTRFTPRKMSTATVNSTLSDAPSFHSEEDGALHDSIQRAQMGLQHARSSGGYLSLDELWDKLFHAAISRTDDKFVTMFMVFFRGFARPIDLLRQMIERFDTLTAEDVADGLVHRFALIRLTNMLGDWVLDYPGDLSEPETNALLRRFHRQLLGHKDTVHAAVQIREAVEATASAVDLDALWSKAVNNERTDMHGKGQEADRLRASLSSGSSPIVAAGEGNSSHDFDDAEAAGHERDGSESSGGGGLGQIGRSRSASDLTSSDGTSTAMAKGAGSAISTGSIGAGSSIPEPISTSRTMLDQKSILRNISNTLLEVEDQVIATELTRLEWAFFTAIQPRDLLRHILVPHDKRDGPVARSISHFNYISNWVCSMILAQGKTKHRARMLEKFFNIASILRHDNNYGSLNSVLGGLSKTAVHRLRQTRELLKGKPVNKSYQSLVRLMSNERSSAAYRLALENSDGHTIPYVGVHLQDILSISDGNPTKGKEGRVHWRKFSLMDEAVMAVVRCQQYDRYFQPNPAVERLVMDVPVLDDEQLYERSLLVEPRAQGQQGGAGSKIKDLKTFLSSSNHV